MKYLFLFTVLFSGAAFASDKPITIEDFLEDLSTVKGVTDRRDPFEAAQPPFQQKNEGDDQMMNAPPLLKYQVDSYTVVAIMHTPGRIERALIKLPEAEKGKVVTVRLYDRLGNRGGTIVKIEGKGIVVAQNQKSALGFVDRAEIFLPLGGLKNEK